MLYGASHFNSFFSLVGGGRIEGFVKTLMARPTNRKWLLSWTRMRLGSLDDLPHLSQEFRNENICKFRIIDDVAQHTMYGNIAWTVYNIMHVRKHIFFFHTTTTNPAISSLLRETALNITHSTTMHTPTRIFVGGRKRSRARAPPRRTRCWRRAATTTKTTVAGEESSRLKV